MNEGRRIRVLELDSTLLIQLLTQILQGQVTPLEGIPLDAEIHGVQTNWAADTVMFGVYHPSFDVVRPGQEPPRLRPYLFNTHIEVLPDGRTYQRIDRVQVE